MARSLTVQQTLGRFKERLERHFGARVQEVKLFGSWARGEANEESDVDVLVSIDELTSAERYEVYRIAYEADAENDWLVVLSPLVYPTIETARLRAGGRRLFRDIDREGVLL
jgi:predicted nucleotidyltransferase